MGLTNVYTVVTGKRPELFAKIRDGQAPDQLTRQLLKDWGFTSSNDVSFIPILKTIGFLSPDGKPTSLYHEYRDHFHSKTIMAQAIRNAYSDVFLIKEHPTDADKEIIKGKFKSFHNSSDNVADLMMKTFYALLDLADLKTESSKQETPKKELKKQIDEPEKDKISQQGISLHGLHYNIQIHLPATKDLEVYNAIFKSLRVD